MNRSEIYNRYVGTQSFESTLSLIRELLSPMLREEYTKIWVQASKNSNNVRFCFTIFRNDRTRTMEFVLMKNFRIWKNTDNLDKEIQNIENIIDYIVSNGLIDYVQ